VQSRFKSQTRSANDIIFDHVTASWWDNKRARFSSNYVGPNTKITTQWSMFYEAHAGHPVGPSISSNPEKGKGFGNLENRSRLSPQFFLRHRAPDSTALEPLEPLGQQHRLQLDFYASQFAWTDQRGFYQK